MSYRMIASYAKNWIIVFLITYRAESEENPGNPGRFYCSEWHHGVTYPPEPSSSIRRRSFRGTLREFDSLSLPGIRPA